MPVYEHDCPKCGEFDHIQAKFKETGEDDCPRCGAPDTAIISICEAKRGGNASAIHGWEIHAPGPDFHYSSAKELDEKLARNTGGLLQVNRAARRSPFGSLSENRAPSDRQKHERIMQGE